MERQFYNPRDLKVPEAGDNNLTDGAFSRMQAQHTVYLLFFLGRAYFTALETTLLVIRALDELKIKYLALVFQVNARSILNEVLVYVPEKDVAMLVASGNELEVVGYTFLTDCYHTRIALLLELCGEVSDLRYAVCHHPI